jgi:beta-glucosidase
MRFTLTVVSLISIVLILTASKPYPDENLSVKQRVENILAQMTLDEKLEMIGGYENFNIRPLERLGIPKIKMADGPVGVRNYGKSTAYPASIGLAASFNTELAKNVGASIGREAKAKNVQIMLGPAMNIHRGPMCGRNFEYLGEDPFLAGEIASSFILGMQNEGVMATAKHYVANYQDYARHTVSSDMDERTLREIYLPAFKACVQKGHVAAVMTAYNLVNGIHCSEHEFLNNKILKGEWKFDGILMSDWTSTYNAINAANGGLDLEMPYGKFMNKNNLLPAINKGIVKPETIDDKIRRMLRKIIEFGYYDKPDPATNSNLDLDKCSNVSLQAAREAVVLLKNNSILPLDTAKIKTIAVLGPNADPAVTGGGGSSYVQPIHAVSLKQGIEKYLGNKVNILYSAGPFENVPREFYRKNNGYFTVIDGKMIPGLRAEIFSNMNLENEPVAVRMDSIIDFDFEGNIAENTPCQRISIRWTGKIKVNETGKYRFVLSGDDGYRLFVNDKLIIEEWRDQAEKTASVNLELTRGREYGVKLEYYQNGGSASFRFGFEKSNISSTSEPYDYARKADAVIIAVGFSKNSESEGFDRTFQLPAGQEEFLNRILDLNKNTVVVLFSGGNVDMESWLQKTGALLHAFYPGQEGGQALAEIIFGAVNPSGKLPVSFEKKWEDNPTAKSYYDDDNDKHVFFSEGVFLGYRYYDSKNVDPRFPFGFGLSYTSFKYSNLKVTQNADTSIIVTFDIKNSGELYGKESAQVYISDLKSSVIRPLKELKGFGKLGLEPGAQKALKISIPKDAFAFYSEEKNQWVIEPGEFEILVGSSSVDIRLRKKIKI